MQCLHEFARVLKTGGTAVVVYSWGWRSLLMNVLLWPQQLQKVMQRLRRRRESSPELYFYPHPAQAFAATFSREGWQLRLYRSLSVPFLRAYIHEALFGRKVLRLVWSLEQRFSGFLAKYGEYPMFVLNQGERRAEETTP
jgi:hypothetical protein